MNRTILRMALVALFVISAQATGTLAGTTGALTGYVVVQSGAPLASAKVTASASSQTATSDTDARGHFAFVSLSPDTYTLTASKDGYETVSQPGITVIADNTRTVTITMQPSVKTIGVVTTRAAAELVKPGTTADVYSVNAATSAKVASLGGGGSLNQAYAALAATPGVAVYPGQSGWFQAIYIRGGDYDQVGYEFDGVPMLRSYDNYPATTANTLGQQELQVYTGAAPADAQGQGLSGYINQVVKSGTYPGFSTVTMGIGTPTLYNGYNFEVGGATPDRNFSYYVASTHSAQDFRYGDQNNAASLQSEWGAPFASLVPAGGCASAPLAVRQNYAKCYAVTDSIGQPIGPGGYLLSSPVNTVLPANDYDRENVINLHFGLPHRSDAGKDDIQLLYDAAFLNQLYYSSSSDWGFSNPAYQAAYGAPGYPYLSGSLGLGYQYLGAVGQPLAANYRQMTNPVYFAYNPNSIGTGLLTIPFNQRDGTANPNNILKLQYQHNFGSSAYFRIYGFSNYSEWPQTCPITFATNFVGYCPGNYYVKTNTNGGSAQFGDQLNDKNLLTVQLADFAAVDYRANDETMINEIVGLNPNTFGTCGASGGVCATDPFAYVVNKNNPASGVCYASGNAIPGYPGVVPAAGTPISCFSPYAQTFGLAQANAGAALPTPACGAAACEWWVAENGRYGGGNSARPNFGSFVATDQIKPSSQWFINLGLRYDRFLYNLSDTDAVAGSLATLARPFWFNAYSSSYCVLPGGGQIPFYNTADDNGVNQPCPSVNGIATHPAVVTNLPNDTETFFVFQPRLGATFTADQGNVFRVSAGRYDQAPNTAFEQYNLLQQDLPSYLATNFWPVGFTTTTHTIYPPTSDNYDLSWEHQFSGTQASFKVTPYYRVTQNQIQNFYLNQKTAFVTGLNVGQQTSDGVEFQLNWGNFNENGLSALLAYTYTHSMIKFNALGTGGTVLDTINLAIQQYNSFTKACQGVAPNSSTTSLCGISGGANAVATEPSGVANPYFNAPAQARLDPSASYIPFSTLPGSIEAFSNSYEVPDTLALVLNYKVNRWAISPQLQLFAGSFYCDPLSGYGVNPADCPAGLTSSVSGDPRYPYGGTGTPFDATQCTGTIAIPDPYTHVFDSIGAFRQPNQLLLHAQLSYQASPRISFAVNVANIINSCFGGSVEPWTADAPKGSCAGGTSGNGAGGYNQPGYNAPLPYGANIYNPGSSFQPIVEFPYQPNPLISPLQAVFTAKLSL
jgi:Carboxypeptidase regulatory-like domain/TonB-dependent Receptor Plug Domain